MVAFWLTPRPAQPGVPNRILPHQPPQIIGNCPHCASLLWLENTFCVEIWLLFFGISSGPEAQSAMANMDPNTDVSGNTTVVGHMASCGHLRPDVNATRELFDGGGHKKEWVQGQDLALDLILGPKSGQKSDLILCINPNPNQPSPSQPDLTNLT